MHLTSFTDYSIRVLLYLAAKGEKRSTIDEIASSYGISRHHLVKVVQDLNMGGYITAFRGKNGGLILKRAPDMIQLGDLIRHTEPEFSLVECFRDKNQCVITPSCQLRPVLNEALNAFFEVLDRYTLADLLNDQRPQLQQLLNIPALNLPT
ncbi:Rrf2 family transcriptional regulator [Vreelandella andesensis]|uniref:Rrf2 family transcriptional regulator n=1 Tax=Vreelandella andesensis TaxID=447567 RepID=A0A433KQP0_9GAMM|nr:Rrf2 family transcriptional regulator [Halomonas andesensis]RUR31992.1 Rrf2 family transcriptional regulator [Halomonas andesensis]